LIELLTLQSGDLVNWMRNEWGSYLTASYHNQSSVAETL
jgi:hypothetical protein